ncbi:MAG: phosphopantothenoylcysteine decarboxylase [Spirochaetes bacterium]|nr:phosphopantothenoylcysteine decarboxylase [Spirochaetota bacterium]
MKKILLGVSSSVSIYKSCELARKYVKDGFFVNVIMTKNSTEMIRPLLFETITGNPVYTDSFVRDYKLMGHIKLKENASILVIAPATANIIGKIANGIADDLLSTTFLSVKFPVIVAPAMNPDMWDNDAVKYNIEILKKRGIHIIEPGNGTVVCGDEGTGKLADIEIIYNETKKLI